jgi:hypothetical protein
MNQDLYDRCIEVAAKAIKGKGAKLDAAVQVDNVFGFATTDAKFREVINSKPDTINGVELINQIKYICELGLDAAKGKKLVYVKTRNLNAGTKDKPNWVTMPDIQESYHALIHLLVRSGLVQHIVVLHTYQNYPIEYSGEITKAPIVKSWAISPKERGEYTGCFVVITYPEGDINTSYHHLSDILKTHQAFSKSNHTWKAHQQAMVAKSAILDATRYIPIFDDVISSVVEHYDNTMEHGDYITEEQAMQIEAMVNDTKADKAKLFKYLDVISYDLIPADKFKMALTALESTGDKYAS